MDMDSNSKPIPNDLLPEVFEFSIGEALYIDCPVRWLPDLQVLAIGYQPDARHVKVTAAQWRVFWNTLNRVGVWRWNHEYCDPTILDGTSWHLSIKYNGKEINSIGSNAYPGSPEMYFDTNSEFGLFLDAVNKLAGTNYRV